MFVQDIMANTINITAEISRQEALNFKLMCRIFSANVLSFANNPIGLPKAIKSDQNQSNVQKSTTEQKSINGQKPTNDPKPNTKKNGDVIKLIEKQTTDAITASVSGLRRRYENEIISVLTDSIRKFRSLAKVIPFGSSQYGFKETCTNFNILINTSAYIPSIFCKFLLKYEFIKLLLIFV